MIDVFVRDAWRVADRSRAARHASDREAALGSARRRVPLLHVEPGRAMVVVRFLVGQDEERALVRLNQKLAANAALLPPGASPPLVQARSIDDVPVMALTLWGAGYDDVRLRQMAGAAARGAQGGAGYLRGHDHRRPAAAGDGGARPGRARRARPRSARRPAGARAQQRAQPRARTSSRATGDAARERATGRDSLERSARRRRRREPAVRRCSSATSPRLTDDGGEPANYVMQYPRSAARPFPR